MNIEYIKNILEIIGLFFIPIIAWLLNTVSQHGKKIIILEERVNDSINRRLTNLETKFEAFDEKLDGVNLSIVKVANLVENLSEKIDGRK
jgi:hypothetical protein